jgi:hypothetical protein
MNAAAKGKMRGTKSAEIREISEQSKEEGINSKTE